VDDGIDQSCPINRDLTVTREREAKYSARQSKPSVSEDSVARPNVLPFFPNIYPLRIKTSHKDFPGRRIH
jgi:hypothetical protein